jgi:hypothetical protein
MRYKSILILCLLVFACGDGRRETDEARSFFERRYPYAELLEVRSSEDAGVARSFVFKYRKSGRDQVSEVTIQFTEDPSTGRWSPQPEEPRSLP